MRKLPDKCYTAGGRVRLCRNVVSDTRSQKCGHLGKERWAPLAGRLELRAGLVKGLVSLGQTLY
jgi:hypothetical protein